jgi:hypothetical protein
MKSIIIKTQKVSKDYISPKYTEVLEISEEVFEQLKEAIDFTRPVKVKIEEDKIIFETIIF